jgi:DNA-binding response OmpR family regulator
MHTPRILIIDNDDDLVNMLKVYMEPRGLKVESARLGEDGLRYALELLPHLVLLDVTLPDIDGFEVCSRLRKQPRTAHIPVLFLTNRTRRSDRLAGLSLGADDYIIKPFDLNELYLRVRNAVDHIIRQNTTDPLTGLPTGSLLHTKAQAAAHDPRLALMPLTLQHADAFRDVYGPLAFGDVRLYLSRVLIGALNAVGTPQDFLGVVDTDTFMVAGQAGHLEAIGQRAAEVFNATADKHYSEADRVSGFLEVEGERVPFMRLAFTILVDEAAKVASLPLA